MTKHIDLLRAHQKKRKNEKPLDSSVLIDENAPESLLSNPYSSPLDSNTVPSSETSQEELATYHQNTVTENNLSSFDVSSWLVSTIEKVQGIFHDAKAQKPTDIAVLQTQLSALLPQLKSKSHTLDKLELEVSKNIQIICNTDISMNDLVQKSIMMMLYTIKIGFQLKMEQQDLIQQAVAAMVHHIGMATVPDEIRNKTGKLTDEELQLIKQAPVRAVEYLETCQIDNEAVLIAAAQANERYDGSGATGLSGRKITLTGRIIGLLSMFEALIHIRPYRQRLLPRDAIRELVNNHKKAFDPMLLKALIESISLYPVGTFVQLNTGEIGQVITVHNKFPLRPVVHINMDKYGNIIAKREVDLKLQPNLMIKKCMYEEALEEEA